MRRFYTTVSVVEVQDGARVLLDARPLKTPAKTEMRLPTTGLAEAVAAEWAAQEKDIRPSQMPLTQFAATALDRAVPLRSDIVEEIVRYADTELLCHRADAPAELVQRQQAEWQPLLDWFRQRYDAGLRVTSGVIAVRQPPEVSERLRAISLALDPFRLVALQAATGALGSVVLGLALLEGRIDPQEAHTLSLLDELYQAGLWGEDAEAAERRQSHLREIEAIHRLLSLLPPISA